MRITEKTLILKQRETIAREALEPGVSVMVVGKPASDGVVVADFIRVFEDSKGDVRGRNR